MKKIIILIIIICCCNLKCFDYNESFFETEATKKQDIINYGYINIPKIKLNSIFFNDNNVDKNIIILSSSKYINEDNSLLVLAAHSGNGKFAYFNNLYKLVIDDIIYITYNNEKYTYSIIDIYYQKKDGNVKIYKLKDTKTLVLITCTNNNKNLQTVYVSKLIK